MKNWFGIKSHTTDEFIHWTDKKPIDKAIVMREAYNRIVEAGFKNDLSYLLEIAIESGYDNCLDNNNPDL